MTKQEQLFKNKTPKKKRCKNCNKLFTPSKNFQTTCSYECSISFVSNLNNLQGLISKGLKQREGEKRKSRREHLNNNKGYLTQKAQKVFNEYIRLRDKDLPCVSCGYVWGNRQAHASHFISVGKCKATRFNELNVHKSCQICNTHLSGNLTEYRVRLINKIGLDKVEELESLSKESKPCKYSTEDLKEIIAIYKAKINELKEI